jgi:hypothetical protein
MFPQRICAMVLMIPFLMTALSGQSTKKPLTNTDVMDMVHAGLAESTIILSIKNSGTNFDTSPQALIELKKSGVSQSVMDAMLSAGNASPGTATGSSSAAATVGDSKALMAKVVAALGGEKALNEVKATRAISNREVKAPLNTTLEVAYTTVYPDRVHVAIKSPKFTSLTVYHPPDGSFFEVNGKRQPLSEPAKVETAKSIKMGIIYVAQHANDPKYTFTINGAEKIGDIQTAILEIATENIQTRWNVDPATGRIIRVTRMVATPTGTPMLTTFEYANWRTIKGISVPFTIIQNGVPEALKSYEINPDIPAGMFDKSDGANMAAANAAVQAAGATTGCPVEILEVDPHHFVDTSEDPWGFALRIKYRNLSEKQIVAEKFAANFFNALHEKKESAWSYTSDQKIKPAETKNASWSDGIYVNEIGMRIGAEVWPVKVMFADETFWEDDGSMQCKSAVWATPVK